MDKNRDLEAGEDCDSDLNDGCPTTKRFKPTLAENSVALDNDTIRILVASDIHLGYMERDAVRSRDTVNTFEEILQIGKRENVDFVLLGGDLFDENKPSREMVFQCIRLLRQYSLSSRPVQLRFLSDASENFKHSCFANVNYEDPNLNVGMPVFSIHGNHDDLAGAGLCALDMLHETGLVNFFGKFTDVNDYEIVPLLLEKGMTKIAIFGLSYQKDERLHRDFTTEKVRFMRPKEDKDDWFNIFVLHQNRQKAGRMNSYIPERFLPTFLDVILWGHEHACRIDAERVEVERKAEEDFEDEVGFVIQPGSSVITQLSHEEFQNRKHVGILSVKGKRFKLKKIPLRTVRPYWFEEIVLEDANLSFTNEAEEIEQVSEYLASRVQHWIDRSKRERSGHPKQPLLPLVRLRVDFTNFNDSAFSTMRFGQSFVDKVANPKDLINIHKTREVRAKATLDKEVFQDVVKRNADELQTTVEDVVKEYFEKLRRDEDRMMVLTEVALGKAVTEYVQRDEKDMIKAAVNFQLKKCQDRLKRGDSEFNEKCEVEEQLKQLRELRLQRSKLSEEDRRRQTAVEQEEEKQLEAVLISQRKNPTKTQDPLNNVDEAADSDDEQPAAPSTGRRGRGRGRGARGAARGSRRGAKNAARSAATDRSQRKLTTSYFTSSTKAVSSEESDEDLFANVSFNKSSRLSSLSSVRSRTTRSGNCLKNVQQDFSDSD